jgi:hypothetical protein
MKILEKDITYKGFVLKQKYRDGKFAIYEQSKKGVKKKWYEVIVIESHDGYEIAGNYIAPAEVYPSSNSWGFKGFTLNTMEEAEKKIKFLKRQKKL